jgi:hypothetical protein
MSYVNRIKLLKLDATTILKFFMPLPNEFTPHLKLDGLPADAEVLSVTGDPLSPRTLFLLLHSDSFPEVKESGPVPLLDDLTMTVWYCNEWTARKHAPDQARE